MSDVLYTILAFNLRILSAGNYRFMNGQRRNFVTERLGIFRRKYNRQKPALLSFVAILNRELERYNGPQKTVESLQKEFQACPSMFAVKRGSSTNRFDFEHGNEIPDGETVMDPPAVFSRALFVDVRDGEIAADSFDGVRVGKVYGTRDGERYREDGILVVAPRVEDFARFGSRVRRAIFHVQKRGDANADRLIFEQFGDYAFRIYHRPNTRPCLFRAVCSHRNKMCGG